MRYATCEVTININVLRLRYGALRYVICGLQNSRHTYDRVKFEYQVQVRWSMQYVMFYVIFFTISILLSTFSFSSSSRIFFSFHADWKLKFCRSAFAERVGCFSCSALITPDWHSGIVLVFFKFQTVAPWSHLNIVEVRNLYYRSL